MIAALALVGVGAAAGAATADWMSQARAAQAVAPVAALAPAQPAPAPAQPAPMTPRTDKPPEAKALSKAFAATAKAVRPSVVKIDIERESPRVSGRGPRGLQQVPPFFERLLPFAMPDQMPSPERGTGSGIITDGGHVVTNRHVVHQASKVKVTLFDGRELTARVVGKDERTDVAVLKLESPPRDLVVARLGASDKLEVGEWVLAVGSPLGIEQTVTAGIVSGTGRSALRGPGDGVDRVSGWIQTDAKINPGNSGGPLVNLDGEVVGMNTWISTGPGGAYGFAVPINDVRRVSQILIKEGRVRYPYLGVGVGDMGKLEPEQRAKLGSGAPSEGAFVSEVTPGGPASKVGLREGDVIVKLDSAPVKGASDVVQYVSSRPIGSRVTVTYVRDGRSATVSATLAERPGSDAPAVEQGRVGLALQTLTPDLARSLGLPADAKGVAVADVAPASPAERAGVQPGDVILEINRKTVTSAEEAAATLRGGASQPQLLRVRGPSGTRFVTIQP